MWVKIDEFLMATDPLKIIWDQRKNSIVSEIAMYQGALYQGCSILKWHNIITVIDFKQELRRAKWSNYKFVKNILVKNIKAMSALSHTVSFLCHTHTHTYIYTQSTSSSVYLRSVSQHRFIYRYIAEFYTLLYNLISFIHVIYKVAGYKLWKMIMVLKKYYIVCDSLSIVFDLIINHI